MAPKNILIVGGGAGGSKLASLLSTTVDASKASITLVDSRPFHIFLIATLRLVVDPADTRGAFVPYDKLFSKGHGRYIQGTAISVHASKVGQSGSVELQDGEVLSYDILVLAPGSTWEGPLGFPSHQADIVAFVSAQHAKFKEATGIVIVGAGAVGCEYAGEIRDVFPNKKITIVHGGSSPINDVYPAKFRNAVDRNLKSRDITMVYNDYVDTVPGGNFQSIVTRKGTVLKADLVINARGPTPNTTLFKTFSPDSISSLGLVHTKPTMQLEGHSNIFAIGDVVDYPEQKQWVKAQGHSAVVAANILSLVDGKPATTKYTGAKEEMLYVTNGRNGGVGYGWGMVYGDWMIKMGKSRTLKVPAGRAAMNYK